MRHYLWTKCENIKDNSIGNFPDFFSRWARWDESLINGRPLTVEVVELWTH